MKIFLLKLLIMFSCAATAFSQEEAFTFSLERNDPKSILILHSVKKFPCKNYRMDTRDYQNADTTIVIIRDFIPPTPCAGPRSVAEEQVPLTPATKRFYIKLWYKGKYDKWRIFQHDTAYSVRPEESVSFSTYVEKK